MNLKLPFYDKNRTTKKPQESTEEAIVRIGKNQFRSLVAKGLRVPVVFL